MSDESRVAQLLDELLDSGGTPEFVCRSSPELLPRVRERWGQICMARAELDVIFPPVADETTRDAGGPAEASLPVIPGHEIESVLGVGGMGVVFRARQLGLNRVVALKMMLAGAYAGPNERARFRREAEAVAALVHPNVVQVHDVGDSGGRPYFTMEFVEDGSLARRLAGTPLPARQAAALVATVAEAVQAAHQRGIIHRDLKPSNILLTAGGTPKVSHFGLARRLEGGPDLTRTGAAMGTPSYMAPEQAEGKSRHVGPAADTYALGAILYECLTGRPPFRAETAAQIIQQVIHQEPASPARVNPRVPRDLATICLKCLDKSPARRYGTAAELAADLKRFLEHEPIRARRAGPLGRGLRWARRRPTAAGLLAAVGLLVLVGSAAAGLQYRRWVADQDRRDRTDREVRAILERTREPLEGAWQAQDLASLMDAVAEGNRAVDIARTGAGSAAVAAEAEAFRAEADDRLERANKNRVLLDAVLDMSAPLEVVDFTRPDGRCTRPPAQPSIDEQYATAFRRWGLDVDRTGEAEVIARLRVEPEAVVRELVAALNGWMLDRERLHRPEADWRRLLQVADELDRDERHRRLRTLIAGSTPPRAVTVAGLIGPGLTWPAMWELVRGDRWQQLQELRREVDPRTDPAPTVLLLAQAFVAVGDPAAAEQILREAVTSRPDQVVLLDALGKRLESRGPAGLARAIECYRAARARQPRLGIALSGALIRAHRAEEGEDVLRALLRQQPENSVLYNLLGSALDEQKKHAVAAGAYRKAIDLEPLFVPPRFNLGMCLSDQGEFAAAERACREAIELRPHDADCHFSLGYVLADQKRHVAAAAAFRKVIELEPGRADAHYNLGTMLIAEGDAHAAEAAFRNAIGLNPEDPLADNNLGMALSAQGRYREAESAFRSAIRLNVDDARFHNNLGMALSEQRQHAEAEAAYRKAIDLSPELALAHLNLSSTLTERARFDEALAVVRKGRELLGEGDPLRGAADDLLEWCRLYLEFDARLPALLRGTERPAGAVEHIELGQLCRIKGSYAAAARFFGDGFAAEPALYESLPPGMRSAAARCAARAARGDGPDAPADAAGKAALRGRALAWLRADLAACQKLAASSAVAERNAAAKALAVWLWDPDLAGLRPGWRRMGMPAAERAQCDALWTDVEATLARARKSPPARDD